MKKIRLIPAVAFAMCLYLAGCEPSGNNNSTDVNTNMREGDDTNRMPYSDSMPPPMHDDTAQHMNRDE